MINTHIYVLIDPITDQVRYVGKANNITQRFYGHISNCKAKTYNHKDNWIKKLKSKNLLPIIKVIDEVPMREWRF